MAGASSASASGEGAGPTGSWLITHQDNAPGNTSKVMAVASFTAGGVLISHDISPAGPPGTGTWASNHDGFGGTFWSGQPGPGGPDSPGFTVRLQIRGRVQNNKISGTFRFSVFDPTGAPADSGMGMFSGHRVDA